MAGARAAMMELWTIAAHQDCWRRKLEEPWFPYINILTATCQTSVREGIQVYLLKISLFFLFFLAGSNSKNSLF